MALSLNQKALDIVSASTLVRLPLYNKPDFSSSPIVVYAKNSLGIVFLNYSDVTKFVVDSNFYFSSVDVRILLSMLCIILFILYIFPAT